VISQRVASLTGVRPESPFGKDLALRSADPGLCRKAIAWEDDQGGHNICHHADIYGLGSNHAYPKDLAVRQSRTKAA
jgi:hypothetical protein